MRLRTVNEPARSSEEPAAQLIAATMRGFGWAPTVEYVAPGRPNVVTVVAGGGGPGPTLLFCGHTDVVTEGDLGEWSVDPYGAELRDGRIYGRGSADMKGGLAAMVHATAALQGAGPFPGRVVLAAFADEEGLMLGAKHFAASPLAREVHGVIVGEPEAGEVCAVSKGAIRLRVDFVGAMAHGAMPDHGRNPIPALARTAVGLAALQADLQRRVSRSEQLGDVYLTPTVALAGSPEQINVIPGSAALSVDVRTIPGVDHAALVADIAALAHSAAAGDGITAEVVVIDDRPPVDTPADHPVVAALRAAHESVVGAAPIMGGVPGTTDGTILARDAGLATVVYGPGGKWIAHQADEFVEVVDLKRCARVYLEAARRFLTGYGPADREEAAHDRR